MILPVSPETQQRYFFPSNFCLTLILWISANLICLICQLEAEQTARKNQEEEASADLLKQLAEEVEYFKQSKVAQELQDEELAHQLNELLQQVRIGLEL